MTERKFESHTGIAAPMLQPNIDTDAIMPSREMKQVSRSGLGGSLFAGWRYLDRGTETERENPEFILNQPAYRRASMILAGSNMGCGSSREFAVWALADFGIRAIIAPSFGPVFHTNCIQNGILPVSLDEAIVTSLSSQVKIDPQQHRINIDLVNKRLKGPDGEVYPFEIDAADQKMLIDGHDLINVTMNSIDEIEKYETAHRSRRSWMYPS